MIVNQHPQDLLGGSEMQCDLLAKYLTLFGHKVCYVAVNSHRDSYRTDYRVVPTSRLTIWGMHKTIGFVQPDIVYWRYNKIGLLLGALVSKAHGCRFVFSISALSDCSPWVWKGAHPFHRFKTVVEQGHNRKQILQAMVFLLDPLKSALNFSALPLLADGVVSLNNEYRLATRVRKERTIHNMAPIGSMPFVWPRPYVVWVANIKATKNPDKYYELAGELAGIGVDFLMIGRIVDPKYGYLADEIGRPGGFHYLGVKNPEEVNGILAGSLFMVHTCNREGFGNNFIQAWLQGKPTVSLYFDPEGIIERHRLGFLSRDLRQLVSDVRCLIIDNPLRLEMGQRARQFAEQSFNAEVSAREYESFFTTILADHESRCSRPTLNSGDTHDR